VKKTIRIVKEITPLVATANAGNVTDRFYERMFAAPEVKVFSIRLTSTRLASKESSRRRDSVPTSSLDTPRGCQPLKT